MIFTHQVHHEIPVLVQVLPAPPVQLEQSVQRELPEELDQLEPPERLVGFAVFCLH